MPLAERTANIVSGALSVFVGHIRANCVGTAMITSKSHRKFTKRAGKVLVVAKSGLNCGAGVDE
jgi:quinolinate synthase